MPHQKESVPIKIVLVGDAQSGKSCLLGRYLHGRAPGQYAPTLGVDYLDKHVEIKDSDVHLNVWDFSGRPEFLDIRNEFYKEASVVLLAVDLSNKKSLESCESWLKEIRENAGSSPVVIVGTKADARKVEWDMGKLAKDKGCTYSETSARDSAQSADQLFADIINIAL